MSEEMDQDTAVPATCTMCDHAKHDGKTCDMDGCDCATDATATETAE